MMQIIISILAAYIIGAIPFSYIIGKANGVDVTKEGSKNPGASNVLRTCGKKAGILAYILDIGKGMLAVFIIYKILPADKTLFIVIAGFVSIVGHIYSVFLGFKGGKGVATSAGVMFMLAPVSILIAMVFFALGLILSKKVVAVGSTVAAIAFPFVLTALHKFSPFLFKFFFNINYIYLLCVSIILALVIIIKHIPNYKRLLSGKENRF